MPAVNGGRRRRRRAAGEVPAAERCGRDQQQRHPAALWQRAGECGGGQHDPERGARQRRDQRNGGDPEQRPVDEDVAADPVHSPDDHCQHGQLHAQQGTGEEPRTCDEADVNPSAGQGQQEPRQHEPKPRQQPAPAAPRDHAQVDAQFVRFGSRQHLHHGKEAVEARRFDPAFLLDQGLTNHRDLRHRAAERLNTKSQEPQEQCG